MWKKLITVCELIAIPAGIIGITMYADRKYYLLSSAALLGIIVLFVLGYEHRRPDAGEVVLVAVMCGLTVVCRGVFIMIPQLMPASAIIVISGMALGAQRGFLIGSMSMFISNFYAGQGPWTIWQMFAYGLLGYLAG